MTIAIGDDVIDVLVHGPNRYFDNYRTDSVHWGKACVSVWLLRAISRDLVERR